MMAPMNRKALASAHTREPMCQQKAGVRREQESSRWGLGHGERWAGEDGAGSCPISASKLLVRLSLRVSTAVTVCVVLITETQNNQLWVGWFHTDSFAFIRLCREINRLVFNGMGIQAVTQRDDETLQWLLLEGDFLGSGDIQVLQEMMWFLRCLSGTCT